MRKQIICSSAKKGEEGGNEIMDVKNVKITRKGQKAMNAVQDQELILVSSHTHVFLEILIPWLIFLLLLK